MAMFAMTYRPYGREVGMAAGWPMVISRDRSSGGFGAHPADLTLLLSMNAMKHGWCQVNSLLFYVLPKDQLHSPTASHL